MYNGISSIRAEEYVPVVPDKLAFIRRDKVSDMMYLQSAETCKGQHGAFASIDYIFIPC